MTTQYLLIDTTDGAQLGDVRDVMDAWWDDDPDHEILSIHLVRSDGTVIPVTVVEHEDTDEYEIATLDGAQAVVEYLRYEGSRLAAREVDGEPVGVWGEPRCAGCGEPMRLLASCAGWPGN